MEPAFCGLNWFFWRILNARFLEQLNGGRWVLVGGRSQEFQNVLLIGRRLRQFIELGIQFRDANPIAAERAKVLQDVTEALHRKALGSATRCILALGGLRSLGRRNH